MDAVDVKYYSFCEQVVFHVGSVFATSSMVTMKLSCPSDVSQFPYDNQTCPIILNSWILGDQVYFIGW